MAAETTSRLPRIGYSPDEAAEMMGLSRELLNDLLRSGQFQSVKAGRRRVISRYHLAQFLGVPEDSL